MKWLILILVVILTVYTIRKFAMQFKNDDSKENQDNQ